MVLCHFLPFHRPSNIVPLDAKAQPLVHKDKVKMCFNVLFFLNLKLKTRNINLSLYYSKICYIRDLRGWEEKMDDKLMYNDEQNYHFLEIKLLMEKFEHL